MKYFNKSVKELYPYLNNKINDYDDNRIIKNPNNNILKKINLLSFDKNDIFTKIKETKLNYYEIIIFTLFTLFPTRRAVDYRRMIIINDEPIDKKFYFFITKNNQEQIFDVPPELDIFINKNNYFLLGKEYTSSTLSKTIIKIFNKIYGISISALEIRRLYSTYMSNKYLNNYHRIEICNKMNHSVEENMKYVYNI